MTFNADQETSLSSASTGPNLDERMLRLDLEETESNGEEEGSEDETVGRSSAIEGDLSDEDVDMMEDSTLPQSPHHSSSFFEPDQATTSSSTSSSTSPSPSSEADDGRITSDSDQAIDSDQPSEREQVEADQQQSRHNQQTRKQRREERSAAAYAHRQQGVTPIDHELVRAILEGAEGDPVKQFWNFAAAFSDRQIAKARELELAREEAKRR